MAWHVWWVSDGFRCGVCRYGVAADVVLSNMGNPTYQGVDEQVLTGLADSCSANAGVGVEASVGSFSAWSGVWGDSLDVSVVVVAGVCVCVRAWVMNSCGRHA